jgi:hypothetical protein
VAGCTGLESVDAPSERSVSRVFSRAVREPAGGAGRCGPAGGSMAARPAGRSRRGGSVDWGRGTDTTRRTRRYGHDEAADAYWRGVRHATLRDVAIVACLVAMGLVLWC